MFHICVLNRNECARCKLRRAMRATIEHNHSKDVTIEHNHGSPQRARPQRHNRARRRLCSHRDALPPHVLAQATGSRIGAKHAPVW